MFDQAKKEEASTLFEKAKEVAAAGLVFGLLVAPIVFLGRLAQNAANGK